MSGAVETKAPTMFAWTSDHVDGIVTRLSGYVSHLMRIIYIRGGSAGIKKGL
jgi:hypothetical protein